MYLDIPVQVGDTVYALTDRFVEYEPEKVCQLSTLLTKILRAEDNTMDAEVFKKQCQELFDKYKSDDGEEGHSDMDDLLRNTLCALGYTDGIEILNKFKDVWYS